MTQPEIAYQRIMSKLHTEVLIFLPYFIRTKKQKVFLNHPTLPKISIFFRNLVTGTDWKVKHVGTRLTMIDEIKYNLGNVTKAFDREKMGHMVVSYTEKELFLSQIHLFLFLDATYELQWDNTKTIKKFTSWSCNSKGSWWLKRS